MARTVEAALVAGALLLRVLVGLSPYSGFADPPKYGDYEAQRHWMEIALGLPPNQWYDEGPQALARLGQQQQQQQPPDDNDEGVDADADPLTPTTPTTRHWPLDYPPLSGYQSWLTGLVVRAAEPEAVALGARSRGYESPGSKVAMRLTVLLCDAAVFFPAAFWAAAALGGGRPQRPRRRLAILAVLLLNPALVLIDHGHFQYNCISLGLTLAAIAAVSMQDEQEEEEGGGSRGRGGGAASPSPPTPPPPPRVLAAAVLFTLALCHKHMALYYAPAFFAHMLGAYCLRRQPTWPRRLAAVAALGVAVAATLAAAFAPVVGGHREGAVGGVLAVLARIFPLRRGLYEDYVANFWCATSVGPLKWRELLPGVAAARAALAATVLAALPAMAERVCGLPWPSRDVGAGAGARAAAAGPGPGPSPAAAASAPFLLCCANCAAAFFLFSFQVHEKSVLLPLMPATLLLFAFASPGAVRKVTTTVRVLRAVTVWGPVVACFGMFPLLERDGVAAAYWACIAAYVAVAGGLVDDALREVEEEEGGEQQPQGRAAATAAASTTRTTTIVAAAVAGALALHSARLVYEAPARLPWLHDRLFVTYAFVFIAVAAAYLNWLQWNPQQGAAAAAAAVATAPPRARPRPSRSAGRPFLDDDKGGDGGEEEGEGEEEDDDDPRAATTAAKSTTTRRGLRQRSGVNGRAP